MRYLTRDTRGHSSVLKCPRVSRVKVFLVPECPQVSSSVPSRSFVLLKCPRVSSSVPLKAFVLKCPSHNPLGNIVYSFLKRLQKVLGIFCSDDMFLKKYIKRKGEVKRKKGLQTKERTSNEREDFKRKRGLQAKKGLQTKERTSNERDK